HRSQLRVLPRIEAAIGLGDGLRTVCREVVPEMLEVDALATAHQSKRCLAVEVEVPEILQKKEAGRIADARNESVHQRETVDFGRILRGVRIGHHQTDIVARDTGFLDTE